MPAALTRRVCAFSVLLVPLACSSAPAASQAGAPEPAPPPPSLTELEPDATTLAESEPTPEPDPETKARALARYERGAELFRQGRYDDAEKELKEALSLYPFMAPANLVLGKVFLIRGAASRDEVLIDSARLMFKMALSIDPELREAGVLLSLFKNQSDATLEAVKETIAPRQ